MFPTLAFKSCSCLQSSNLYRDGKKGRDTTIQQEGRVTQHNLPEKSHFFKGK